MSLLKNAVLASLLMLAATPAFAGDLTRDGYVRACVGAGLKAGVDSLEVSAVCTCASQILSLAITGEKFSNFTIPDTHEFVPNSVILCRQALAKDPTWFMEKFGTLSVSNGKSQEGT